MYFPFLYGRQSELLALRAMLEDGRSLDLLLPVIEPVNRDISSLARCVEAFESESEKLAVIINPDKHELQSASQSKAWSTEIRKVINQSQSVVPVVRCNSATTLVQITALLKQFKDHNTAIAYASPSLSDADVKVLASMEGVRFHIVLDEKMASGQQNLLPRSKRVDIRDYFNKQVRNADYGKPEFFTDRYRTFKPSWAGFGDYGSLGARFTVGGGRPGAVTIHAIYKQKQGGGIWIEHFVSDDKEQDQSDTATKFLQAAKRLVDAAKSRPKEFGRNFALDKYAQLVADAHSPGLAANKKLQIAHHICLMLDVLGGTL